MTDILKETGIHASLIFTKLCVITTDTVNTTFCHLFHQHSFQTRGLFVGAINFTDTTVILAQTSDNLHMEDAYHPSAFDTKLIGLDGSHKGEAGIMATYRYESRGDVKWFGSSTKRIQLYIDVPHLSA